MTKASEVVVDPHRWLDTPLAVPAPRGGDLQIRRFCSDLLVECNILVLLVRNSTGSTSGVLKNAENCTCVKLTIAVHSKHTSMRRKPAQIDAPKAGLDLVSKDLPQSTFTALHWCLDTLV